MFQELLTAEQCTVWWKSLVSETLIFWVENTAPGFITICWLRWVAVVSWWLSGESTYKVLGCEAACKGVGPVMPCAVDTAVTDWPSPREHTCKLSEPVSLNAIHSLIFVSPLTSITYDLNYNTQCVSQDLGSQAELLHWQHPWENTCDGCWVWMYLWVDYLSFVGLGRFTFQFLKELMFFWLSWNGCKSKWSEYPLRHWNSKTRLWHGPLITV